MHAGMHDDDDDDDVYFLFLVGRQRPALLLI